MRPLQTERLILRNWIDTDQELFHLINSDETVMEFFPYRRNRLQSNQLMDFIRESINEIGFGFAAIELRETGKCIGFTGLSLVNSIDALPKESIEIGWRLAPDYWGKGYVTEAARKWLQFGFESVKVPEIISFAVQSNHRSIAVMERLGMRPRPELTFNHESVPDTYPHLKRHVVYSLDKP